MTSTDTDTLIFREGDVYRFSYSQEARDRAHGDLHWCFDGQVVVRNGLLVDTYWAGTEATARTSDARVVKPSEGTLTFVCNLSDVQDIRESECRYYADEDVINLSWQHGCYRRYVIRKGTQRSAAKMLAWLDEQIANHKRCIASDIREVERLVEQRVKVEAGDTTIPIG